MKTAQRIPRLAMLGGFSLSLATCVPPLGAQSLLNVDFGVGSRSAKTGFAATGHTTNDFWNLYRHYDPRYTAGRPLVADGSMTDLRWADGTAATMTVSVTNAPGVWGNSSGDPMFDTYLFAPDGSNLVVTLTGLDAGRCHFYLYGHAGPDVTGEQNSVFRLRSAGTNFGPLTASSPPGWKAVTGWHENQQYVVFRDVEIRAGEPVVIDVAPGPNGVAVLNGLQVISRGTSPPRPFAGASGPPPATQTNLSFHEVRYAGTVSDHGVRFAVEIDVESRSDREISAPLFEGELALLAPKLPPGLRILGRAREYHLVVATPGRHRFTLDLAARVTRDEPWNRVSFRGPAAVIASIVITPEARGLDVQLLSGPTASAAGAGGDDTPLRGFLGADRTVALRWRGRTTAIARASLLTADTLASAHITPTVIKLQTQLRYEILQAPVSRLEIGLPAHQVLTRLEGGQVRDWQVKTEAGREVLAVEFIKPVDKTHTLTLFTEQPVEAIRAVTELTVPEPLGVVRESGSWTVAAEEMHVETVSTDGLRQVNAPAGAFGAYRFHSRPARLSVRLNRFEPLIATLDRVTARIEEGRVVITHALGITVERTGLYALELEPPTRGVVTDVQGEGIEDWRVADGRLSVTLNKPLLGSRLVTVMLEEAQKSFPTQSVVTPLRVRGARQQTAQIGVVAAPGLFLRAMPESTGLREIPISALAVRTDEVLAFGADQPDWRLALAVERLPARVVAEVFNLITVGEGLVGGSATLRYGLVNQGVRQFRVKLPAHWRNVEFTGPNLRRQERETNAPAATTNDAIWLITLQDKAWGSYTLVVTYDYPFEAKSARLDLRGAHALGVERETGSVAITMAASLKLEAGPAAPPLRVIDPTELADSDRALISRPVLLAYRYHGGAFGLTAVVARHDEVPLLDAIADRTQLTSVLTEAGEMLTEASFMVKNHDRQFQKFRLPPGARFWGCQVNGQPAKAETDGDWLLVSLPRGADRDEAFGVTLVYAQQMDELKPRLQPRSLKLSAPETDVPNTYAEWRLYAPSSQRLSGFGGNMVVAQGTTYGWRDAWSRFWECYRELWHESGRALAIILGLGTLVVLLVAHSIHRGVSGALAVVAVVGVLAILAGMMLPALSKAKAKAGRINAASNLKQIALAARIYAQDHNDRFPATLDDMTNEIGNPKVFLDPESGQRFIYVGAGKDGRNPQAILAYSPVDLHGRAVAFADGSVQMMTSAAFNEALRRDAEISSRRNGRADESAAAQSAPNTTVTPPAAVPAEAVAAAPRPPGRPRSFLLGAATGAESGGGGATPALPVVAGAAEPGRAVAGLRSLRIEIPRAGREYGFTKVLNLRGEPLTVRVAVMPWRVFQAVQTSLQVTAFVAGLILCVLEWRRADRRSLRLAVGAALVLASVGHLSVASRTLHYGLIVLFPVVAAVLFALLIRWLWPRRQSPGAAGGGDDSGPAPTGAPSFISPLIALLAASSLGVNPGGAQAAEPAVVTLATGATNLAAVSIVSAHYTGTVVGDAARFEATIEVVAAATNQTVPLFDGDVALEQFDANARDVSLRRESGAVRLHLPERGRVALQIKFLVGLGGAAAQRQLAFGIPPALSSRVEISIDEPEADIEFPTAVALRRLAERPATRIEAVLGAGDRVDLRWTPRVKRIADMAASVFAHSTVLATVGDGVVNTRSWINYQVAQGELRQARVALAEGVRLLRVEGEMIRTWELHPEGGEQILSVDLLKPAAGAYRLVLETEQPLGSLPARTRLVAPQVREVIRATGLIGLRAGEDLNLVIERAHELQRVEAAEFKKAAGAEVRIAHRFLRPDFELVTRTEPMQPEIHAAVRQDLRIEFDRVRLEAQVNYTIQRAGVFHLRLAVPAEYRIESITSGHAPLDWRETSGPRTVTIRLKERALGALPVRLTMSRPHADVPAAVAAVAVVPLEVTQLSGLLAVTAEPGLALKTGSIDGLAEIPATALGGGAEAGALAFKFVAAGESIAPWRLTVAVEPLQPSVRAEIVNLISVGETFVSGRARVRYEVQNAPVKEFRLRTPPAWAHVEITGANVRQREFSNGVWRVELQNRARGLEELLVTWEQPRDLTNAGFEISGIEAVGVDRETGAVALFARSPVQLTERTVGDGLRRIDPRELPGWAGTAEVTADGGVEVPVLAYRHLLPGSTLVIEARRYDEAAVLQALVDGARLTTVVADDGQVMTEMALTIRNNGLQHLEMELPPRAHLWSARVAGQPVRPAQREGRLLLPLDRLAASDGTVAVELTYVGTEPFPRRQGRVRLASPRLDLPLQNVRWELYLPPDYDHGDFAGTMTAETEPRAEVQTFSSSEYYRQEERRRDERVSEARRYLGRARSGLAGGKVKEAAHELSQAERLGAADPTVERELADLKRELDRAQSSNLIQAQQTYALENVGGHRDSPGRVAGGKALELANYDAASAERQWRVLRKAQEVSETRLAGMRANLPTRGRRFAFTQVLHTEINRPMTIEWVAANTRTPGWWSQAALVVSAFLGLWLAAALVSARQLRRPVTA